MFTINCSDKTGEDEKSKFKYSEYLNNVLSPEMVNTQFGIPHMFEHRTQKDEYDLIKLS
jgi:hypothetical protein